MKRRSVGLLRRFFRSLLKDSIMQNLRDSKAQPSPGLSNMCSYNNGFTSSLMRNHLTDISYGSGQNLIIPSSFFPGPLWENSFDKYKSKEKTKFPFIKTPDNLPDLVGGSKTDINTVNSSNYYDDDFTAKKRLMCGVQDEVRTNKKVTDIGPGSVGSSYTYTKLLQKLTNQENTIDNAKDKLGGKTLDVEDIKRGATFDSHYHVKTSTKYESTTNYPVYIVRTGVCKNEGESRLDLMSRNAEVMKSIIPLLIKRPSNSVDIIKYISWELNGLPEGKRFGSGSNFDSSMFRVNPFLITKLGLTPVDHHGRIIGEHMDNRVAMYEDVTIFESDVCLCNPTAVYFGTNIAGVRLADINPCINQPDDPENWSDPKKVINSGGERIKLKRYTSWAIRIFIVPFIEEILSVGSVGSVSLIFQEYHDIKDEVLLSLSASLGNHGVNAIIIQQLSDGENGALSKLAQCNGVMSKMQPEIKI